MYLQKSWFHALNARMALLKFRLPYDSRRLGVVSYLGGRIMLPIWGPQTTTECRLITKFSDTSKEYDVLDYNERLYYFNTVSRSAAYPVQFTLMLEPSRKKHCFDCYSEEHVLCLYVRKLHTMKPYTHIISNLKQAIDDALSLTSSSSHDQRNRNNLGINEKCGNIEEYIDEILCSRMPDLFQKDACHIGDYRLADMGLPLQFRGRVLSV